MRNRRSAKRAETPSGANLAMVFERYSSHPRFIGVRVTDANQRGAMGDTILHMAVEAGALRDIETLVNAGADVNAVGDIGNTPLHSAALMGLRDAAERLLDLRADPNVRNEFNETPADVAAPTARNSQKSSSAKDAVTNSAPTGDGFSSTSRRKNGRPV